MKNIFAQMGVPVSVPAGAGFNGVQPTVLVTRIAPSGARIFLEYISCRAIDIGSDQISFALRVNGAFPVVGLTAIPGQMFDSNLRLDVQTEFSPGTFEIVAYNKSGTTQTGALAATAGNCQASFKGEIVKSEVPVLSISKKPWWALAFFLLALYPLPSFAQTPPIGCEVVNQNSGNPLSKTQFTVRRAICTPEGVLYVIPTAPNNASCFLEAVTVTTQCFAAPGAGLRWYITAIVLSNDAATVQSLDIVFGTGANCVTGLTAATHKFQMGTLATTTSPFVIALNFNNSFFVTSNNAVCVRPSAATAFGATMLGYIAP